MALGARALGAVATMAVLLALLAGCGGSHADADEPDRSTGILVAVLTWAAGQVPAPSPSSHPIVYVLQTEGAEVDARAQVDVVRTLRDEVTIRFADERDEAILTDAEEQPVRDDGALATVGAIPAEGDAFDLPVLVYRTMEDQRKVTLAVAKAGKAWTVNPKSP
jgi:hypothetical protein